MRLGGGEHSDLAAHIFGKFQASNVYASTTPFESVCVCAFLKLYFSYREISLSRLQPSSSRLGTCKNIDLAHSSFKNKVSTYMLQQHLQKTFHMCLNVLHRPYTPIYAYSRPYMLTYTRTYTPIYANIYAHIHSYTFIITHIREHIRPYTSIITRIR